MQMRQMAHEFLQFKQTSLYRHYKEHFQNLYALSVKLVLTTDLKGPETLFTREGIIGEARSAELQAEWFETLYYELATKLRDLKDT